MNKNEITNQNDIQNYIKRMNDMWGTPKEEKEELKEKLAKLKEKEQELTDEQGYWGNSELQKEIEELEELLDNENVR